MRATGELVQQTISRLTSATLEPAERAALLRSIGLWRRACSELRESIARSPGEGRSWRALFDLFVGEDLPLSARKLLVQIDSHGLGGLITETERVELSRYGEIPPISLYIPCFNGEGNLEQIVSAVRAQSLPPRQILVVDDCSTDNTPAVVARMEGVQYIRHPSNRGLGATRNTAIDAAIHPLTASLDSDVVPSEFWLERLVVTLVREPLVGAFGPLIERNAVTLPDRWRARVMPLLYPGEADIDDAVLYGSNTLFTTAALRAVGGYDPRFRGAFDDIDLGNKFRKRGLHIRYVHRAVCEHMRRDSLQKVLHSCYSYRKERAVKERMFDDALPLETRWNTLFRDGIKEIEELYRSGAGALVFPSLLNIFWTIVHDLFEFLGQGTSAERQLYASHAIACIARGIECIPDLNGETRATLQRHLAPRIADLQTAFALPLESSPFPADFFNRCFAKCEAVLHFEPRLRQAIEAGAAESLEATISDRGERRRLAVVELGYLWGESGAGLNRSFDQLKPDLEVVVFDRATPLRELIQREGALKGYRADLVVLCGEGADPHRFAWGAMVLREWLGAGTRIALSGVDSVVSGVDGTTVLADFSKQTIRSVLGDA